MIVYISLDTYTIYVVNRENNDTHAHTHTKMCRCIDDTDDTNDTVSRGSPCPACNEANPPTGTTDDDVTNCSTFDRSSCYPHQIII